MPDDPPPNSGHAEKAAPEPPSLRLGFHGGLAGALVPLFVFLGGVAALALSGAPDERGFWPILVVALAASLLLARDRHRWSEVVIEGMSQPLVMLMVVAWLLAGVLAESMNASGFVEALGWLAATLGVAGAAWVVTAFLIAAAVSTATGTSLGTLILTVPLLHPAGVALGADPVVLLGSLIAGATFGDNVSPVSDTTIASAATQRAEMGWVVRSRLRYALPAGAVAIAVYAFIGGGETASFAETPSASPAALLMLLAPLTVFVLLLRRTHLVHGLLVGNLVAVVLALLLGRIELGELIYVDHDNFVARGLISNGLERGIGISIFTLLLMGLISTLTATGLIERMVESARHRAHSARGAETWIAVVTSAVVLLTTHAVVTILAVGRFAAELGREWDLSGARRANLLDLTVSTWPFLLPWFIPTILASSLAAGSGDGTTQRISPLELGMANVHSWALLVMLVLAIATGYGRRSDSDEGSG